jgi:integrase
MQIALLDVAGHRRSPVTMPGFHEGRAPRNKGRRYPADPPTVEEIIAVMREAGDSADGVRLRALIVILWRAGLRIGEALDLAETDLDPSRGAVPVRRGKGGRRREVGMDRWAWSLLEPWALSGEGQDPALLTDAAAANRGRISSKVMVRSAALPAGEVGGPALDERQHAFGAVLGPQQRDHVVIEARGGRRVPLGQRSLS